MREGCLTGVGGRIGCDSKIVAIASACHFVVKCAWCVTWRASSVVLWVVDCFMRCKASNCHLSSGWSCIPRELLEQVVAPQLQFSREWLSWSY